MALSITLTEPLKRGLSLALLAWFCLSLTCVIGPLVLFEVPRSLTSLLWAEKKGKRSRVTEIFTYVCGSQHCLGMEVC